MCRAPEIMANESSQTETERVDRVGSTEMVGEAPQMTPASEGLWWLWWTSAWCPCHLAYDDYDGGRFLVRIISPTHGMHSFRINDTYRGNSRWGGRLAVPGASHTVGTEGRSEAQPSKEAR